MAYLVKASRNTVERLRRAAWLSCVVCVGSCSTSGEWAVSHGPRWELRAFSRFHPEDAQALRRVGLANGLTRALAVQADDQGNTTLEELESWTNYHWASVDRPPVFRTVHVVVRVKSDAPPAEIEKAERVAAALHVAVQNADDAEAFETRAREVDSQGLDVKVEKLDFVAEDGRVMRLGAKTSAQTGRYEETYARAAAALAIPGAISPVVRTSFGFHVLRLEETLPSLRLDEAARLAMARRDVVDRRARLALQALLKAERERLNPTIERSAEEATAKVRVE